MRGPSAEAEDDDKRERSRTLFVSVGIVLFALGFAMTVFFSSSATTEEAGALSEAPSAADDRAFSTFEGTMAFIGIFVGLLGVVTATVGPLTTLVVVKGRR